MGSRRPKQYRTEEVRRTESGQEGVLADTIEGGGMNGGEKTETKKERDRKKIHKEKFEKAGKPCAKTTTTDSNKTEGEGRGSLSSLWVLGGPR